jgi:hypothetical protein
MLTATAIVVLHVIVWDCSSGTMLVEFTSEMPDYAAAIDSCRRSGDREGPWSNEGVESQGLS